MKFKYNLTLSNNEKLPFVNVMLKNSDNGRTVANPALIDSGAFSNVFHADIATVLGIDLTQVKKTVVFGGVGSKQRGLRGKMYIVEMMVSQKGKSHSFDSPVVFSDDISPDGYPLLGRIGFFDQFSEVIFSYKRGKVELVV